MFMQTAPVAYKRSQKHLVGCVKRTEFPPWQVGWCASRTLRLQLVAGGALFRLLIHLEENTRASAQFLDKIRMRLESSGEGVKPFLRTSPRTGVGSHRGVRINLPQERPT
jgi:hypothetical protein